MSYIEAIQNQIDATSPILERIVCLCPVPERGSLNSGGKVCGKKRYDRVTVGLIEEDINHWQHKTRAVLAACYVVQTSIWYPYYAKHKKLHGNEKEDDVNLQEPEIYSAIPWCFWLFKLIVVVIAYFLMGIFLLR